jgi:peptide-methionine (S)-S-oxide reductase
VKISYENLLQIFWDSHDPTTQAWSSQYRHVIFYHNDAQKKTAEESRDRLASLRGRQIATDLVPFTEFFLAEDYHQKFRLRNHYAVINEFEAIYPDTEKLISSTAAARVNGYLGGNGTCDQLKSEISSFGLSEAGNKILLNKVCLGNTDTSCPSKSCN